MARIPCWITTGDMGLGSSSFNNRILCNKAYKFLSGLSISHKLMISFISLLASEVLYTKYVAGSFGFGDCRVG